MAIKDLSLRLHPSPASNFRKPLCLEKNQGISIHVYSQSPLEKVYQGRSLLWSAPLRGQLIFQILPPGKPEELLPGSRGEDTGVGGWASPAHASGAQSDLARVPAC